MPGRPYDTLVSHNLWSWVVVTASLTVKLASRYIIRSLKCLIGDAVSPEGEAKLFVGLGAVATPLEVGGFDGRWVMGLVP